jgi:hypothetical protein
MRAAALLLMLFSLPGLSAELEGVRMDDRLRLGAQELELNGMALRTRAFFKVYVAGLYLAQKTQAPEQALRAPGPKRMELAMLRDVGAETFAGSLLDGLKDNNPDSELARLKPQVDELMALMQKIGEAKKGMRITLDFAPGAGTSLLVNGAPQGKPIAGEDFFPALLRIWLGERPVSADMKKALLGGA